ncbi:MAG TPA: HNH endonuclease signature motif containing protein [Mycobacteriales bacterium]|nr:HNH endonuclease signature motif containing protein [Mycobacteriales bacterium]
MPAEHGCATGAWTGPATRSRVEALLCDARLTRVLLDGTGQVRGLETLTDTVTASQRRALAARDLGCAARDCTRPPAACDAHHLLEVSRGGATTLSNLVLLCRRHHVLWHRGQLRLTDLHVPWHPSAADRPPDRLRDWGPIRAG